MATLQRRKGGISGSDIVGGGEERVEEVDRFLGADVITRVDPLDNRAIGGDNPCFFPC